MTRALLLLTGGRGVPDMLALKYFKPDVVLTITTVRGQNDAMKFQQFAQKHFQTNVEILPNIDPVDEEEIKNACRTALEKFPAAEWIIHFTGAPKVVGIYAHDVARDYGIPLCFLETDSQRLVSLVKELAVDREMLFTATVEEYMGAYGRTYEIPKSAQYRVQAQNWYPISQFLVHNLPLAQIVLKSLRTKNVLSHVVAIQAEPIIDTLVSYNLATIRIKTHRDIHFELRDATILEFLRGDWLEVYVWQEAIKAGFAYDCQWGYKIVVDEKLASFLPSNELDLALTYKARLLIAECKAKSKPFDPDFLYKLYAISNLIGASYVRQIFITDALIPSDQDARKNFESFHRQAEVRNISIITGDQLSKVGELLSQQVMGSGRSR